MLKKKSCTVYSQVYVRSITLVSYTRINIIMYKLLNIIVEKNVLFFSEFTDRAFFDKTVSGIILCITECVYIYIYCKEPSIASYTSKLIRKTKSLAFDTMSLFKKLWCIVLLYDCIICDISWDAQRLQDTLHSACVVHSAKHFPSEQKKVSKHFEVD